MIGRNRFRVWVVWGCVFALAAIVQAGGLVRSPSVSIVVDEDSGPATRHGVQKVGKALQEAGLSFEQVSTLEQAHGKSLIVVGAAGPRGVAVRLLEEAGGTVPTEAEALAVRRVERQERPTLILCWADDRGTMYAALDAADRIGWTKDEKDPLRVVRDSLRVLTIIQIPAFPQLGSPRVFGVFRGSVSVDIGVGLLGLSSRNGSATMG